MAKGLKRAANSFSDKWESVAPEIGSGKRGIYNPKYKNWYKGNSLSADLVKKGIDAGVYLGAAATAPISAPVAIATGKSVPTVLGYKNQSDWGKDMQKGANLYSRLQQGVGVAALNSQVPGSGTAVAGLGSFLPTREIKEKEQEIKVAEQPIITSTNKPVMIEDETMTTGTDNLYSYRMKNGGLNAAKVTINVEKGELLVDSRTGDIIEDYLDKPKHPPGKNNVDMRGFTKAKEGTVVIPAKYRGQYLSKDSDRLSIIKMVIANTDNDMKAVDGYDFGTPVVSQSQAAGPYSNQYGETVYPSNYDFGAQTNSPAKKTSGGGGSSSWAAGIPETALGLWQTQQAMKGLKALDKQPLTMYNEQVPAELAREQYRGTLAAELANKRARTGLSADEMAAYKGNVAQQSNLAYQRGVSQSGGSLAQAIRAGINSGNVANLNQLAVQDAQMKARKQAEAERMAQYAGNIGAKIAAFRSQQQNANAQYLQRRREMLEKAYGAAMSQGTENIASGASSMLGASSGGSGGLNAAQLSQLATMV